MAPPLPTYQASPCAMSAQEGQRRSTPVGVSLEKEGFSINIFNLCVNFHARESNSWGERNRSLSLDRRLKSRIHHRSRS